MAVGVYSIGVYAELRSICLDLLQLELGQHGAILKIRLWESGTVLTSRASQFESENEVPSLL